MSNNFIVVGTPRSGTTFFCRTLDQYPDIWIPGFGNYEPFNPHGLDLSSKRLNQCLYNQNSAVQKMIKAKKKYEAEYFGFKTFITWHNDFLNLVEYNNLDIFVVLRKDIWKVLGSLLIAIDNGDYSGSSKNYEPFYFSDTNREKRRIISYFFELCKSYWYCEKVLTNHATFVDKIYLEDFDKKDVVIKSINNYFQKNILFNTDFKEDDYEKYYKNFEEFRTFILEYVYSAKEHYSEMPDYIKNLLEL
jgi:hypothetical protein